MSNDQDIDVKIDVKKGTARATITAWAVGIAVIIGAAVGGAYVVLQAVFALYAAFLGFDDIRYGDVQVRRFHPGTEQQHNEKEKKEEPKIAAPAKPIQDRFSSDPGLKISEKSPTTEKRSPGAPLVLTPKLVDSGTLQMISPVQQGDEDEDKPENAPKAAFKENGRLYLKRPFKCEALGGLPMKYEGCYVSPKSSAGRPTIRE